MISEYTRRETGLAVLEVVDPFATEDLDPFTTLSLEFGVGVEQGGNYLALERGFETTTPFSESTSVVCGRAGVSTSQVGR